MGKRNSKAKATDKGTTGTSRRDFLKTSALAAGGAAVGGGLLINTGRPAKANGEPIPIGCMTALTGPAAASGQETKRGFELAVEEINAMGGIVGRPIEGHVIDTKNRSAEEVVGAANLLIDRHGVHAIVNGHNIGSQNAEYETVADAGIIYIHTNTLLSHREVVTSDPERYFSIFMGDPAEYWYGPGWLRYAAHLRDSGKWTPANNKLALVSGSSPYSITIINAAQQTAADFGWDLVFGPEIIQTPTTQWGPVLAQLRDINPALLLHSHLYAGDIANFMIQFRHNPTQTLIYFPWGPLLAPFREIGGTSAEGVISSTVMGLPQDRIGEEFNAKYTARYGADSSAIAGCVPYGLLHHFALCAAAAGGTGEPGDYEQNRKIAEQLKRIKYRAVFGTINYHPEWQSAVPYPDYEEKDPSLGMPHLFYQIHDHTDYPKLIAPYPYDANEFRLPAWLA